MYRAPMPRRLRLRSSIAILDMRLPVRSFAAAMIGLSLGLSAVSFAHTPIDTTAWITLPSILAVCVVVDGRLWGLPIPEVARILARHLQRPHQLFYTPPTVTLDTPTALPTPTLRLRWRETPDNGDTPDA